MAERTPCILVVEDDPLTRKITVEFLKRGGHNNVFEAALAEQAIFMLFRDRELRVDLLLLDLMLPNASGLTVIRKLREAKTPRRKNLPVIVITGRTDTETYKMATRRGIHGYLLKPLSAALLNETVNGVLAAHGHKPPKPLDTLAATSPPPGRDLPPSLDDKF